MERTGEILQLERVLLNSSTHGLAAVTQPATNAATNFRALSETSSGVDPGVYSADPKPNPAAPALIHPDMLSGVIPPTGNTRTSAGRTARIAFSADGLAPSAGNSLSAVAPARSAANASLGVSKPGNET